MVEEQRQRWNKRMSVITMPNGKGQQGKGVYGWHGRCCRRGELVPGAAMGSCDCQQDKATMTDIRPWGELLQAHTSSDSHFTSRGTFAGERRSLEAAEEITEAMQP